MSAAWRSGCARSARRTLLQRAQAIRKTRDLRPSVAARIDFELAQALWESGDGARRVRARALLLRVAPTLLDDLKIAPADERAAICAWLEAHEADLAELAELADDHPMKTPSSQ